MSETFHWISYFFVVSGWVCTLLITLDLFSGRKQQMPIMNAVWPLTGLWGSWLGLAAYAAFGRAHKHPQSPIHTDVPSSMKMNMAMADITPIPQKNQAMGTMKMDMNRIQTSIPQNPTFRQITLSTLHCGAGCTLADLTGEWLTVLLPLPLFGSLLAGQWTLDYALALIFGLLFQFAALRSMRQINALNAFKTAFKVDFLSLSAWQVGMYGLMAIMIFGIFRNGFFTKNTWEFWFLMQMAMGAGFLTAFPVNRWLIKKGIKPTMM